MFTPKTFVPDPTPTKTTTATGHFVPKTFVPDKPSVGGFINNVGTSAENLVTGIGTAIAHPIDTAKGMYQLGSGVISKFIPGRQKSEDTADAVGKFYKNRYGGVENIKNTLYNDPIGALADVSTVISGVGAGAGLIGKAGTASKLARASSLTDPLAIAGRAVGATTRPLTKFFPKMMENLPKADDLVMRGVGNPTVQKKMIVPAEKLVPKYNLWERTPEAVTEVIKDLNKKRQGAIEGAGSTANLQDLLKPLDDAILELKNNKFAMKSDSAKGQLSEMMRRRQDLVETFSIDESVDMPPIDTPKLSVEPVGGDLLSEAKKYKTLDEFKRYNKANTPYIDKYLQQETGIEFVKTGYPNEYKLFKNGKRIGSFTGGEYSDSGAILQQDKLKFIIKNISIEPEYGGNKYGTSIVDAIKQYSELKRVPVVAENVVGQSARYWEKVGFNAPKVTDETAKSIGKNVGNATYNPKQNLDDIYNQSKVVAQGGINDVKPTTKVQPFEQIKSTNLNPKVKLSEYDAFRREAIDPDVPQGAFDQALSQNKAKDAGAKTARRSIAKKVDELAGTKGLGQDLQSLYKLRDVFEGYQARVKNRQTLNVHKMGGGILGGSLAGAKGAITGFLVEQIVNSPKGLEMMYKVAKGVEKGAFGKKLGQSGILSGIEKELAKYNLPNTKEIAKMIYNYGRAGRMTNND